MREWIVLILITCIVSLVTITGIQKKNEYPSNKTRFYLKDTIVTSSIIILFFIIAPTLFTKVDFHKVGKGFFVRDDILSQAEIVFYLPFFMSLLLKNYLYPKSIVTAKEVFGYPVQFLPNSYKEYFIFCLYIITGVVYEELLCRQFAFRAFNETLHLRGDTLLIITAAIFAIGHLYQGWKGLLCSFILGLVLGKFFQMKENIVYPIFLHVIFNMTILSLSYRRLKDFKDLWKTG